VAETGAAETLAMIKKHQGTDLVVLRIMLVATASI
jgi:hypothetical protein